MNLSKNIILIVMVLLLSQCGTTEGNFGSTDDDNIDYEAELELIEFQVQDLIADLSCESASDCTSIAYGSRPCGGPEEFLIYSTLTTDVVTLESVIEEYNLLDEEYDTSTGSSSICAIEEEPEVDCIENICEAVSVTN